MIEKIANSLGINNEEPNIALAEALVRSKDKAGIQEIVNGLSDKKEAVANDCIKVLYEIGYREPELISGFADTFIRLLKSRNNRMVWGSMTALATISHLNPQEIFNQLDAVIQAYQTGSVITVDNSISVFAGLVKSGKQYEEKVFSILIHHLENCRPKEVAQHAERTAVCITKETAGVFKDTLMNRYGTLTDPQKKRVDKLIKHLPQ